MSSSSFPNPTPILHSIPTYEDMIYVFLLALVLFCLSILLLIHLCSFCFASAKSTAAAAPLEHPEGPVLGELSHQPVASGSSRVGVDESGSGCVVCLSSLEEGGAGAPKVLPRCGHSFHVGCISRWLVSRPTCPLCRTPTMEGGVATTRAPAEPMAPPSRMRMEAYERMHDLFVPLSLHSYFL